MEKIIVNANGTGRRCRDKMGYSVPVEEMGKEALNAFGETAPSGTYIAEEREQYLNTIGRREPDWEFVERGSAVSSHAVRRMVWLVATPVQSQPDIVGCLKRLIDAAKPHCVPTSQLNMRVQEAEELLKALEGDE